MYNKTDKSLRSTHEGSLPDKKFINVVVFGHVDSGKSTTAGHLLYKCSLSGREKEKFQRQEQESPTYSRKYSEIFDTLPDERNKGLTIESHSKELETSQNIYSITDTPGHRDFLKNIIQGIYLANIGILIISAVPGEFETGITRIAGRTREYSLLAYTFGLKKLIVAVNKMDAVQYNFDRFSEIERESRILIRKIGYKDEMLQFLPISGWIGDNLTERSQNLPWWNGHTLLQALESANPPNEWEKHIGKPLRIPVRKVVKISGIGDVIIGIIAYGELKTGDFITLAPCGAHNEVFSMERYYKPISSAGPGDLVGFHVKNISELGIKSGYIVGDPTDDPPCEIEKFTAKMIFISHPGFIKVGYSPILHIHTASVPCTLINIQKTSRNFTAADVYNDNRVKTGDFAIVEIAPKKPICVEKFSEYPLLGRFAITDLQQTVAVGMVQSIVKKINPGKYTKSARK